MADFGKLVERLGKSGADSGVVVAARKLTIGKARILVILLIVAFSAMALRFGWDVAVRLTEVEQGLAKLSQKAGAEQAVVSGDEQLQAQMHDLTARVNALSVIIEGPFSHLRQTNEESLVALSQRIERLEREASARSGAAALAMTTAKPGSGVPPANPVEGGWVINLISLSSEKDAKEQMLLLRKAGVRVELQHAQHDGKSWYRLRVPGFTSYEGARAYIETVEKQTGVENAWVGKE